MSSASSVKTRSDRAASLKVPRGRLGRTFKNVRRRDALVRMTLCVAAAVVVSLATQSWSWPFPYRNGYIPTRDIPSRVAFSLDAGNNTVTQVAAGARLAQCGVPLSTQDVQKLYAEHLAVDRAVARGQKLARFFSSLGIYATLFMLCGVYLYLHDRSLLKNLRWLAVLLAAMTAAAILAILLSRDEWRAESLALMVFGMGVAISVNRQLAILLSIAVSLIVSISLGHGLQAWLLQTLCAVVPILLLGRIRSRTELIQVGLASGVVVFFLTLCAGTLAGQTFGVSHSALVVSVENEETFSGTLFLQHLASGAAWYGLCAVLSGFLMTGVLPFLERVLDVNTDIRLLELGDAAHPLLQELAQRAPGTYNHSMNVASLGEAAAEGIGANGLLVRVGAYFHDIGKMFKPEYFVENQGSQANQHDTLVPAMSTLVIIAHVKDGANLARQHGLPKSIIDFIEQHHGTTLLEYFYHRAERQNEGNGNGSRVDEATFRYPGPKPQTKEAAVLMMADAVESACRTLTEPTPARIEGLVHEIAMKRLLDGQFDESGLTMRELNLAEETLVRSLAAVYHSRIKYPTQQTA